MFKKITNILLAGLLAILPIYLTGFLLYWMFQTMDAIFQPFVVKFLHINIRGLGFLVTLGLVFAIGLFVSNVYGAILMTWLDGLLVRLPVFKGLYRNIKRIIDSLNPKNPSGFKEFVLIKNGGGKGYSCGFLTNSFVLSHPDGSREDLAAVYIPSNHLYLGAIHLVEKERIVRTPLSLEDGAALALSAGASIAGEIQAIDSLDQEPAAETGAK